MLMCVCAKQNPECKNSRQHSKWSQHTKEEDAFARSLACSLVVACWVDLVSVLRCWICVWCDAARVGVWQAFVCGCGVLSLLFDTMAERSKALVLGTSLRAWVRIPLVSLFCVRWLAS